MGTSKNVTPAEAGVQTSSRPRIVVRGRLQSGTRNEILDSGFRRNDEPGITFKDISIIIPVGPGENALEALLDDLRPIEKEAELIVVRGASRPKQLNDGVRRATRDFLWFLHADSRLAPKTLGALLKSLGNDPHALHYFNLRFLPGGPPLMFINEIGCWIRSRILGVPFGDQGFAVSKEIFETLGGFPENVPYGEDHLFVWCARQKNIRLRCTGVSLYTSARRYAETGWARLTWDYARRWTRQAWPEWKKLYEKTSNVRQVS